MTASHLRWVARQLSDHFGRPAVPDLAALKTRSVLTDCSLTNAGFLQR